MTTDTQAPTPGPATPDFSVAPLPPVAPLMLLNGQPISHAAVMQRMDELKADPKFMERVAARDANAFEEYNRLWRLSHGLPETPAPPSSPVDVDVERDARLIAQVQQHAANYADRGYTELQQIEIVGQRPILADEQRWHRAEYERKRSDPEYMRRWAAGSRFEIEDMNKHAIAMKMRVATLEEIQRWEGS